MAWAQPIPPEPMSTQAADLHRPEASPPPFPLERLGQITATKPGGQATANQATTNEAFQAAEVETAPISLPGNPYERLRIPFGDKNITYGFGSISPAPTGLLGPGRDHPVAAEFSRVSLLVADGFFAAKVAENQAVVLEVLVDVPNTGPGVSFDFEGAYYWAPESLPGVFGVNFAGLQDRNPAFQPGPDLVDVTLPNGDLPWVNRWGGGVDYSQQLATNFEMSLGLNYQRISVRDRPFGGDLQPVDEFGNALTVSSRGQDDLLALRLMGLYDAVEIEGLSPQGTRVGFGLEQTIPVGAAQIFSSRFVANGSQFIPLNLIKTSSQTDTLILNLQAGLTLGDVPPYNTLSLGGANTVRGYRAGQMAAGRSFLQGTVEYQFPLFDWTLFKWPVETGATLFVDYGTSFGTDGSVIGQPGVVRGKPGDGLGYGLGLHFDSFIGLLRFEFGLNDQGNTRFLAVLGDRF
jgi:outer membrane protein insertion porin family